MDLTTAIIEMSKAAENRRVARKSLVDATELVAKKIVEEGRAGDAVTVDGVTYAIQSLQYPCSQWENVGCTYVGRANTMLAGDTVLLDSRSGEFDGNNMHHPKGLFFRGEDDRLPWSGPAVRRTFAGHAGAVVAAFAAMYAEQAKPMAESAASISKLAIK